MKYFFLRVSQVYHHFRHSLCANQAAALSFDSLLALAPCLILAFNLLAYWPLGAQAVLQAKAWLVTHLMIEMSDDVNQILTQFMTEARQFSWPTWLGLLWSAGLLLNNLQESLARIWQVPLARLNRLTLVSYGALLLSFPLLLTVTLWLVASLKGEATWLASFLPSGLLVGFLYLTYRLLPGEPVPRRLTLFVTVLIALLIHGLKLLLIYYFSLFQSTYQMIYGTLAVLPLCLIWLFLVWVSILLGSVISFVMVKK